MQKVRLGVKGSRVRESPETPRTGSIQDDGMSYPEMATKSKSFSFSSVSRVSGKRFICIMVCGFALLILSHFSLIAHVNEIIWSH